MTSEVATMDDLEGKAAIVTGGAGGIGSETAMVLARCGASVLVVDIDATGAERVAATIRSDGGSAVGMHADVADESAIRAMVESVVDHFGGLDILFNNAAATGDTVRADGSVVDQDSTSWDWVMAVNLRGPMLACKYSIPHMLRRGGGSIVNTVSPAGLLADASRLAYGVSKAGLTLLTKHVASSHGADNIRSNAIAASAIIGPNTAAVLPEGFFAKRARHTPFPRLGVPHDIANVVAFLCRDESAYINGVVIPVDGGFMAHLPHFADYQDLTDVPSVTPR